MSPLSHNNNNKTIMNKFNLLKLCNQFPTMVDVINSEKNVLTLFIITITRSNPLDNLNILVLIDLKSHKILSTEISLTSWKANIVSDFLEHALNIEIITGENTVLHLPKQSPFTTRVFAIFLLLNHFDVSFYIKPNYLPNINVARVYLSKIVTPYNFEHMNTIIQAWNSTVAPSISVIISKI
jgi:hypothetical protein